MSTTTVPVDVDAKRADLVTGIRELADFIEQHPDVPVPRVWACVWSHAGGDEGFRAACDAMRPHGFTITDRSDEVEARCEFSGGVHLYIKARRDRVAERVTEVKKVTEFVLPEWAQPTAPTEVSS